MDKNGGFYLLEETIEAIRQIERNLALNMLDPAKALDLGDAATRNRVNALIRNLDILLSREGKDPRLLKLVVQVKGLREFLLALKTASDGSPEYAKWLQKQGAGAKKEINSAIGRVVAGLEDWARLAEEKVRAHIAEAAKNKYLEDIPSPQSPDHFYVMVKELNPLQTRYIHPFDPKQLENQKKRSTKELLEPDPTDPISGYRVFEPGDKTLYPGSGVRIVMGHHRTFELYRRFLMGKLDGDTLILVKKRRAL